MSEDLTSEQVASIVERLCNAEGEEVVLRFTEALKVPTSKYDGVRYQKETSPKATLRGTIKMAIVEDEGETLICNGYVTQDEMERVGINPAAASTEDVDGKEDVCYFEIHAERKWWLDEYEDVTREEAEQAIEEGREDEVLPPWDEELTVTTEVERTSECKMMAYKSESYIRYKPPQVNIGELIDIRVV